MKLLHPIDEVRSFPAQELRGLTLIPVALSQGEINRATLDLDESLLKADL